MRPVWALSALWCAAIVSGQPGLDPETRLAVLDPNRTEFPAASLVDFHPALQAPAGRHGFAFVGTDGHLYFEDGSRARFWGINIAKDCVFVPHDTIDRVADTLAQAGFNLVRLHHIDGVEGLLPAERAGAAERLEPAKLDSVFYWVHALKQRGLHVYLDLLDFRTFQEAEGVPQAAALGRGAKPAAVFNERLIELQIAYARDLLFGRANPYTQLPLGRDPAVALVELCDENGLFARWGKWAEMPAPYLAELQARWNFWLRATYGSSDQLAEAWAYEGGRSALGLDEHLEDGTVRLLSGATRDAGFPSPLGGPRIGPLTADRERDLMRFCHDLHREYFGGMQRALRRMGLRTPLTAVTEWEQPADLSAVAATLDFVGCNWYYDHPIFAAGNAWHLPSFYTNANPVSDKQGLDFASCVQRATVEAKPLIVREWGVCWPSKFRGSGLLEAAAYGALQDLDGMILFTYDARPERRRIEYFDVSSDPVRWGVVALAGQAFLARRVSDEPEGQLHRRVDEQRLLLDAPGLQAVAGALGPEPMQASVATFRSASPLGVLGVLSLTDQPLADTPALLVRMTTIAANTGESKAARPAPPDAPQFRLDAFGDGPVLTHGKPAARPSTVELMGKPLIAAYLENGTWEALRNGSVWHLWCDTPGAKLSLPGLGPQVTVTPFAADGPRSPSTVPQPFAYPNECLFVRVTGT